MAKKLRQEIKDTLTSDNQLAADFCDALGVSIISLPQMLYRNPKSLTQHETVEWLKNRLNKTTDEILIEATDDKASKNKAQKAVP